METPLDRPWWLLPPGRVHAFWWVGVGALLLVVDYVLGPEAEMPVGYVIPVALAAWYSGRGPALALAGVVPLFRLGLIVSGAGDYDSLPTAVAITLFRGLMIAVMALWFARLARHERQVEGYVLKLEGLLPICSFCKSIRNEGGRWERLEGYISARSGADFSHGLCPDCVRTHYS